MRFLQRGGNREQRAGHSDDGLLDGDERGMVRVSRPQRDLAMSDREQIDAFAKDLDALVARYCAEFELSTAAARTLLDCSDSQHHRRVRPSGLGVRALHRRRRSHDSFRHYWPSPVPGCHPVKLDQCYYSGGVLIPQCGASATRGYCTCDDRPNRRYPIFQRARQLTTRRMLLAASNWRLANEVFSMRR